MMLPQNVNYNEKTKKKLGLKSVNSNHYVACYHAGKVIPPQQ